MFQFQIGTIGSVTSSTIPSSKYLSFNSRLVRLVVLAKPRDLYLYAFQFQIGTIGSWHCRITSTWHFSFQFQIGTIGSFCLVVAPR